MSNSRTASSTAPCVVTILPPRENTIEAKIERTADFCHRAARTAVNAILDSGKKLAELKAELRGKDEWLAAFGEDRAGNAVSSNPFPFGRRTADRFITIYEKFGAGHSVSSLPPSWGTLYELTKLSDAEIKANKTRIRPDMTRSDVAALRRGKATKAPATKRTRDPATTYEKAAALLPDIDARGLADLAIRCIDLLARDERNKQHLMRLAARLDEKSPRGEA